MPKVISTLASELLVSIFLYLDLQDLIRCKQVIISHSFAGMIQITHMRFWQICKQFSQVIDDTLIMQYKIACETYGLIDGDPKSFSLVERSQRLHDMQKAWASGTPPISFDLPRKWTDNLEQSITHQVYAFGCVVAICQVSGNRVCKRMHLTQIPSEFRNIPKKYWSLDNLEFDIPGFDIDFSQNLLVTTRASGYSDNQTLSIRILDATNAGPHPQAKVPLIKTSSMRARQLQIAGDYLGILSDSASEFLPEFRLYNWKTGERLMSLFGMDYGSFALLDGPYVILPAKKRDQPVLSILPCKKGTRSYDNAIATAVAYLKLPLRQAGNMIIYADRARGPPHDAVVPFRQDPTRRWLRVDALGVEELDEDEDEDDLAYRARIGLYIPYGQILALISQTQILKLETVESSRHSEDGPPSGTCDALVADCLGTRLSIFRRVWDDDETHSRFAIFDFNPLAARKHADPTQEASQQSDEIDAIESSLSSLAWYSKRDTYRKYDWMKTSDERMVLLLDDGFVNARYWLDQEDLERPEDEFRTIVWSF
ncbi:hypothetical protein EIP86_007378 [Pleurotus ostreatoroseus]|nr:hypothetical protein EIP86_007378 [Pleurotus ostreatoroseus]